MSQTASAPTVTPAHIAATADDAAFFLSRVVPRGDDEAVRLDRAIQFLQRLSSR